MTRWRFLPILLLLLWANLLGSRALFEGAFLDYNPINGDFQTYNPLRRMSAGELPGRDFMPYLGLGTTYATYAPYLLLGQDFSASKTGSYLVHALLFSFGNFVLLMLLGCRRAVALALSFLIYLYGYLASDFLYMLPFNIALTESGLPFAQTFRALSAPENSCLGIRTALPFISSAILLLCYRRDWLKNPRTEAVVWGLLTGAQVLWSNDYGFVSALMLTLIYNIYITRGNGVERLAAFTTHLAAALLMAMALLAIFTAGNPGPWMQYNFSGVAKDQFWYFMFDEKDKIFSPDIFLRDKKNLLFLGFSLFVGGGLALHQLFAKQRDIKLILLVYIIGTTLAAAIASSIGGGFMWRYFSATVRLAPFLALWGCYLLCRRLPFPNATIITGGALVTGLLFAWWFVPVSAHNYHRWVAAKAEQNYFYEASVGGYLPESQRGEIAMADKLKALNLPPEKRLFSTYSTLVDAVSGARQASDIDYIIHALGTENRQHYLRAFDKWKPAYVSTPREQHTLWETWSRRVNWWFYREMLPLYEPAYATPYHIFWKRRAHPAQPVAGTHFTCHIESNTLVVHDDGTLPKAPVYVELAIANAVKLTPSGVPFIGNRGLMVLTEVNSALDALPGTGIGATDNRSYTAPLNANPLVIGVEHLPGTTSRIALRTAPQNRTTLEITRCSPTQALPKAGLLPVPSP